MEVFRSRMLLTGALVALLSSTTATIRAALPAQAELLVTGLASGSGSTIGPGGALFVTEGATGNLLRVDPRTGDVSTLASGLPPSIVGIGGAMDVAFYGSTAYVLVTLVGPDVGGTNTVGIYRVDGPNQFTVIADIGAFSIAHPPETDFFVPSGVQYSIEAYRGGFLVTDGHHNRVLWVTRDGGITELKTFGNIVPTGMAIAGDTIYMAEAGPVPHLPEHGRVVAFSPRSSAVTEVAAGARLTVDVEFGRGRTLYALSQGFFTPGNPEGSPADNNTGALFRVNGDGTMTELIGGLDQPTSMEIIGTTAYVVTLGGEIWKVTGIAEPPYGAAR